MSNIDKYGEISHPWQRILLVCDGHIKGTYIRHGVSDTVKKEFESFDKYPLKGL